MMTAYDSSKNQQKMDTMVCDQESIVCDSAANPSPSVALSWDM